MGEAGFNKLEKSGDIFYESYSNAKSFLRHFDNKKNHEITRQNAKRKKKSKIISTHCDYLHGTRASSVDDIFSLMLLNDARCCNLRKILAMCQKQEIPHFQAKGQLISKWPFGFIVWTNTNEIISGFLP